MALWIAGALVLGLALFVVLAYNGLIARRNRVRNAWSQVDVQLRRRYDLVPRLVETVRGYATHEQATFTAVTEARTAAERASGPAEQGAAEARLQGAIARQVHNDTVLTYNNACQQIPTNIVAAMFAFRTADFFEIEAGAEREPVPVRL